MSFMKCFVGNVVVSGLLILGGTDTSLADPGRTEDLSVGAPAARGDATALAQVSSAKRPVVLVAGLLEDAATFTTLAKALRADGFDVTVFVPPDFGFGDINDYAALLGKTVEQVVRRTRALEVDLIGHSEGGLTARRYVQITAAAPVRTLVSLGSPQQGTEVLDLTGNPLTDFAMRACTGVSVGCRQMAIGSLFLVEMNEQSDPTPGDARYLAIGTEKDVVTQPVARSAIPGAEHLVMQQVCPGRNAGHFGLLDDAWVRQVILSVLAGGRAEGDCRARPIGGGL